VITLWILHGGLTGCDASGIIHENLARL